MRHSFVHMNIDIPIHGCDVKVRQTCALLERRGREAVCAAPVTGRETCALLERRGRKTVRDAQAAGPQDLRAARAARSRDCARVHGEEGQRTAFWERSSVAHEARVEGKGTC